MSKPKKPAIAPTSLRLSPELLKRTARVAKKHDRSRAWLINKFIEEGLARDDKPGALD